MRPDFTLSFWPDGYSLDEAESQELAIHIHFDAKYRVENITEIFGNGDEDLVEEKAQQKRGNYKRADLLKSLATYVIELLQGSKAVITDSKFTVRMSVARD